MPHWSVLPITATSFLFLWLPLPGLLGYGTGTQNRRLAHRCATHSTNLSADTKAVRAGVQLADTARSLAPSATQTVHPQSPPGHPQSPAADKAASSSELRVGKTGQAF